MRLLSIRTLLLVTLLAAQSLAFAHEFTHEPLEHAANCTTCVIGSDLDLGDIPQLEAIEAEPQLALSTKRDRPAIIEVLESPAQARAPPVTP